MKIIDLLNKIANGEEVPEIIKYNDNIYTHYGLGKYNYYCKEIGKVIEEDIIFERLNNEIEIINDEIEIIEKPKKIEKLSINITDTDQKVNDYYAGNLDLDIADKINEIIDYINKENK